MHRDIRYIRISFKYFEVISLINEQQSLLIIT